MKINLLEEKGEIKKTKRSHSSKFIAVFSILTLLFFYNLISAKNFFKFNIPTSKEEISQWTEEKINFLEQIGLLVRSSDKKIKGEKDGRINILLLGMGGVGHEGTYLTDTIILISIKPKEKVALLSIPRDMVIPIPGYGWRKINNANAFGELNSRGSGGEFTKNIISQVFDIPIHYYVRVDFDGFKKVIDDLGGVGIYVEKSFTDYSYPTFDFKYQTISFEKGWQVMDGETALKFVRSRHGTNGESSDFARSKRQQKVLLALKEKILSLSTLINPQKIYKIYSEYQENVKTDFEVWEMFRLAKIIRDIKNQEIVHRVLDDSPNSPLYATNAGGAYILTTRTGDFSELQSLAKNIFEFKDQVALPEVIIPSKIEIQNGTKKNGLAANTAQTLEKLGFEIIKIGNAKKQDYQRTLIYDLTKGQRLDDLTFLKEKLNADVSVSVPTWLLSSFTPSEVTILDKTNSTSINLKNKIDFLIILGENANYF